MTCRESDTRDGDGKLRTLTETTLPCSRARAQESRTWGVTPVGKVVLVIVLTLPRSRARAQESRVWGPGCHRGARPFRPVVYTAPL